MAIINEIHGDIFNSKMQTIVNTVNCFGIMGKGIALEFRNRYPEMFQIYQKQCKEKKIEPGILYLYKKSNPWILNFPTKYHWRNPSKLDYIKLGLEKFSDTYKSKGIYSIAFPKLGTQNGGLNWEEVKILMYEYLLPLNDLEVEIYHYLNEKIESIQHEKIEVLENPVVSDSKK